jgi:hypothetical protein
MKTAAPRGAWVLGASLLLLLAALAAGFLWFRERRAWLRPPAGVAAVCILVEGRGETELDLRPVNIAAVTAMNAARQYRWDDFAWKTSTSIRPAYVQYYPAHEAAVDPAVLWSEFVPALRKALSGLDDAPRCRFAVVDAQGNVVGLDR